LEIVIGYYDNMKLIINTPSALGIKEQIKRQIIGLIESGGLKPGVPLPSSRDLALTLGVNRNTTWAAYRELTKEGWLSASVGSGTYVKSMEKRDRRDDLGKLFDEMLSKAEDMGYGRDEVADRFLSRLACQPLEKEHPRILVVECNHETGVHMAACLEKELKAGMEVMLIQEIEENPRFARRRLKGFDLVVCGFNHLEEFKTALPDSPVEAAGVFMKPDLKALEILARLPAGTSVGLTCANRRSTETLFKEIIYDSGSSLKRIWVGMDDEDGVREMVKACRVVLASHYVHERVSALAGPETRVIRVELCPDPAGLAMVRSYLKGRE
jgi:DNA-binding transcriptional regulator YhcF (GntR family)